jgi:hypothetical protein
MGKLATILCITLVVFLPACTTEEAPVDVGVRTLELTFQGDSCSYAGPTELLPGPVELIFNNNGEGFAAVNFLELLEGKTIQDLIEYNGEEPSTKHAPSWSQELGTWKLIQSGEQHKWAGELEEGNYFMVCANMSPFGVWLGTGLTVTN